MPIKDFEADDLRDLDEESPALASLARGFAHTVDNYADNLEGKTVE